MEQLVTCDDHGRNTPPSMTVLECFPSLDHGGQVARIGAFPAGRDNDRSGVWSVARILLISSP